MRVGEHTFQLIHTPGHTPGQVAVYVPEERVVFTGDTVFSECQTWLMTSNVDQWIAALEVHRGAWTWTRRTRARAGDDQAYLATQRAVLLDWIGAVATAVAKGWTREETIERVTFADSWSGRCRARNT